MPEKEFSLHRTAEIRISENSRFTLYRGGFASPRDDIRGTTAEIAREHSDPHELHSEREEVPSDWISVENDPEFLMSQFKQIVERTPALRDHPLNHPPKK